MKKQYFTSFILILMVLLYFLFSCNPVQEREVDPVCGQDPCYHGPFEQPWVSGLKYHLSQGTWPHDNKVLKTEHFLIFSDTSSDEVKIRTGMVCEQSLSYIKDLFCIDDADLGFNNDLSSMIEVFSMRRRADSSSQEAQIRGFSFFAFDSNVYFRWPRDVQERHGPFVTTHELTHVIQAALGGHYFHYQDWWTEGLAEYVSGGVMGVINDWESLKQWKVDHLNPIQVHRLNDAGRDLDKVIVDYYPVFHLAVKYLFDPDGLGRPFSAAKQLLRDVFGRGNFETAFAKNLGMDLEYYETHFYDLMKVYLKKQTINSEKNKSRGKNRKTLPNIFEGIINQK